MKKIKPDQRLITDSPIGPLAIELQENTIIALHFLDKNTPQENTLHKHHILSQLFKCYFEHAVHAIRIPINPAGTDFEKNRMG